MRREFSFSDADFGHLVKLVKTETGIALSSHKKNMVYSRLAKRLRVLGFSRFDEYIRHLEDDASGEELGNFVNAVTTNLTFFFREHHHFEHLGKEVIATMVRNPPTNRKIRIWSAGCSSGMEPYSIAMTVRHYLPQPERWDVKILATDIDTSMIRKGQRGVYPIEAFKDAPKGYRERYTEEVEEDGEICLRMKPEVREMIAFNHLNLLGEWPIRSAMDVIFCRNVVIYFDKETQRLLFDRYAKTLRDGSFLYIGHSENLSGVSDRFQLMGRTIYRKMR